MESKLNNISKVYKISTHIVYELIGIVALRILTINMLPELANSVSKLPIVKQFFPRLPYIIAYVAIFLYVILGLMILILLFQVLNIIAYQFGKSPIEYFQSMRSTYILRRSSFQSTKSIRTKNGYQIKQQDPVRNSYNKAVRQFYVDINATSITVWLKMPKNFQAQEMLIQNLPIIAAQIKANNPMFTYSDAEPDGNYYLIAGTRVD